MNHRVLFGVLYAALGSTLVDAASAEIPQDSPFTVTVTCDGTPPFIYQWSKDGKPIAGATEVSYRVDKAGPADAGAYTVRVTNKAGDVVSDTAVATVLIKPTKAVTAITL